MPSTLDGLFTTYWPEPVTAPASKRGKGRPCKDELSRALAEWRKAVYPRTVAGLKVNRLLWAEMAAPGRSKSGIEKIGQARRARSNQADLRRLLIQDHVLARPDKTAMQIVLALRILRWSALAKVSDETLRKDIAAIRKRAGKTGTMRN